MEPLQADIDKNILKVLVKAEKYFAAIFKSLSLTIECNSEKNTI